MAKVSFHGAEGQVCVETVVDWKVTFTDSYGQSLTESIESGHDCNGESKCLLTKLATDIKDTFTSSILKNSFEWQMNAQDDIMYGEQPLLILLEVTTIWK